jgi:uncharacterized membrane protein YhfC
MDILVRSLNSLLMIAVPLALGAWLAKRFRVPWRIYVAGAITFAASQAFHLPFNSWLLTPFVTRLGLAEVRGGLPLILLAGLFGLSAGIFEEGARYLVYRFWMRTVRSWREALMFGAGHGGIEAILLGGLAAYGLVQAIAYRGVDLITLVPPERLGQVEAQLAAYWAMPWYTALLGALERIFTLCFHVSAAVLVMQVFKRQRLIWLAAAILWHTLLNTIALFAAQTWGIFAAEGLIGVMALVSLCMIWMLREPLPSHDAGAGMNPPMVELPSLELDEASSYSEDHLDETRFI